MVKLAILEIVRQLLRTMSDCSRNQPNVNVRNCQRHKSTCSKHTYTGIFPVIKGLQISSKAVMDKEQITGVILAGGQATRMGGQDKGLLKINDQAMVVHVIKSLKPQVAGIVINANRNQGIYRKFGYPVIGDDLTGFQGPLAGMAAAMGYASTDYIFTCPCDGPLLPVDIVARLCTVLSGQDAEICVAHDGTRIQSVYALIDCRLHRSLREFLACGGRKIEHWYKQCNLVLADFSEPQDCFLNVNEQQDLAAVSARLEN